MLLSHITRIEQARELYQDAEICEAIVCDFFFG